MILCALAAMSSQLSCCRLAELVGPTSDPSLLSFECPSGRTSLPSAPKPSTSSPTEDVRPDSISCLWRKRETRARPRPSSRRPLVSTERRGQHGRATDRRYTTHLLIASSSRRRRCPQQPPAPRSNPRRRLRRPDGPVIVTPCPSTSARASRHWRC